MWTRIWALIIKELLALLRDPKARFLLIGPPLIQLVIFSYAATLEVQNINLMVLNHDSGRWGAELVQRIEATPYVRKLVFARNEAQMRSAIDRQAVIGAVEIGPEFSRDIDAGRQANVGVILDGRKSNASQIVGSYINAIVTNLASETPMGEAQAGLSVTVVPRNWFNPNLIFQWAMVPSLIADIALVIALIVTALSVARERELGTFDQLMVSPLRTQEILVGKLIPPIMVGFFHMTAYILAAVFIFGVPLRGSLIYIYASAFFYLGSVVGIGLFISSLAATQQQAILGAFLFLVPATLLSGLATPIANMPFWLQQVTLVNPLRYFLVIVKGLFLKDIGAATVLANTIPLALIALCTLSIAGWLFRRRMQ